MGGFYICRTDGDETATERLLADARVQFAAHGFGAPTDFSTPTHRGFHVGAIHGGPATFLARGDDFVAVAGTLVYRDQLGTPALERLLDDFRLPFSDWERLTGHFALLIHKGGRTALMTDYFGAFQVFHDPDFRILSTSFLATIQSLPRLHWSPQGVYEFAFNVFPTGDDTVFEEIRRLGPDVQLELGPRLIRHPSPKPLPDHVVDMPIEERLALLATKLRAAVAPFRDAYGSRMQCPLSGGLDSRLALALLRDAGIKPHVYVYGRPGDEDVDIACAIAEGEDFDLEVFQKPAWRQITPDDFAATVTRNFHETDALVTDGGLFDNGGNAFARHARQIDGQLAVSGGCGEVFRNFFYLPNRPMRARSVVAAFFARYTLADTTECFLPRRFIDALEQKALAALDRPDQRGALPRPLIEQLYPRMRCRAFFGREISLVGRHGSYFMPFFEQAIVAEALQLPMDLKSFGRFEAMLLTHIDPKLAGYPSAYGHSFTEPPGRSHIMSELGTRIRPAWLRQQSYALRRRLGPMSDDHGGLLTPAFLGRVIDLHFPHMRAFFNVGRINDTALYRRIATLEYLGQHIEDRLSEERLAA